MTVARRRRRAVTAVLVAALLALLAPAAHAELLRPCPAGAKDTLRVRRPDACRSTAAASCRGRRAAREGAAAGSGRTASGTVLAIAGGPGQAAVPLLRLVRGRAGARCCARASSSRSTSAGPAAPAACAALRSRARARLVGRRSAAAPRSSARGARRYTTAASVDDVEAVRAALGAERLILYGASYGTKVALDYAAAYPQHVERLVLDSVVLPEGIDPVPAQHARVDPARPAHDLRAATAASRATPAPTSRRSRGGSRAAAARLGRSTGAGAPHRVTPSERATCSALLLAATSTASCAPRCRPPCAARSAAIRRRCCGSRSRGGAGAIARQRRQRRRLRRDDVRGRRRPVGARHAARAAPRRRRRRGGGDPDSAFAPFDRATVRALGTADLCRAWPESPIVQPHAAAARRRR